MSIVMSLNNRLLHEQRVVVARSVLVDEVTQGYERIHATVSHRVLHGAVDKLRFAVPAGFEVTRVESTLLARWEEKAEEAAQGPGSDAPRADDRADRAGNLGQSLAGSRARIGWRRWPTGSSRAWCRSTWPGRWRWSGLLVEDRLRPENIAVGEPAADRRRRARRGDSRQRAQCRARCARCSPGRHATTPPRPATTWRPASPGRRPA